MKFARGLLLSGVVLGLFAFWPGRAEAQSHDQFFTNEACRQNPNSEECICASVLQFGSYPTLVTTPSGDVEVLDIDNDGFKPFLNPLTGFWEDQPGEATGTPVGSPAPPANVSDLVTLPSVDYGRHCSLSYFRENLRRLWYFAAALGGGLATLSLAWGGVAYMQSSASGADLSRARGMIMRVALGVIILACAYLVWEGVSTLLFSHLEFWTLDPNTFYDFSFN